MIKILIVDDSHADAELLQQALLDQAPDIAVSHVLDGDAAVEFLDGKGPVDLIVLDHYLPKRSAEESVAFLREKNAGGRGLLIILTSHISARHREALLEAGALLVDDKPMDWDGYLMIASKLIGLCKKET